MGSDRYCLRWNNHQNNLLGVFSQLLQEESLVDVTLACSEGHSIRAHKVVLSACSSYFQSLFVDHPNRHPIIILKDVCFAELRTLVEFMYRGEVNLEYCQLPTFLKTAESLQVKGLAEMTHLRSTLSPDREILPAVRDGQHVAPDEQPPPTVIADGPAIMANLEPLPLVRRRSRSPTDTESSDKTSPQRPQQPPTPTAHQLSPARTALPTASPPAAIPFDATSHHRGSTSSQSPMSVSPPPPDTCSTFGDDRSPSPADDDDLSSTHSGANDLTTSSQRSSPPCLKVIPGPSFLPVQDRPLSLKKEPNSDCDIKNEERSSGGNNGSDCSSKYFSDADLFERQAVYTCTYCGAAFPHQSKLTRHILSHSLETLKYREQSQSTAPTAPPPYGSPFVTAHHASAIGCAAAVVCAAPGTLSPAGAIIASAAHEAGCGNGASCVTPLGEWGPLRAPLVELPQPLDAQQSALEVAATETPGAVCKFCGKAFPDVGALIGHLPAHTGDRPFKCEFCGKAFKLRHHMKDHCRVHTGERPFRCSLCGKTFSRSTILKAHEKTHYPKYVRKFLSSPSPEEEHRPPDIPLPCDLSMGENNVEASTSTPPMYVHRPTPSPSP